MTTLDMFGRLLSETMSGTDTHCSSQTGKEENGTKLLSLNSQQVTSFVSLLITTFYKSGFFVRIDDNTSSSGGGGWEQEVVGLPQLCLPQPMWVAN